MKRLRAWVNRWLAGDMVELELHVDELRPIVLTQEPVWLDMSVPGEPRTRFYGGTGTIHRTGHVDVEVDETNGDVVAVWFRCQPLPFKETRVASHRANEMRGLYERHPSSSIEGVTLRDAS